MERATRWNGVPARTCVESCFTLAPPAGKIRPGGWSARWPRSGVAVSCRLTRDGAGGFVVAIRHNWRGGGYQSVRLEATTPNFSRGGSRWWFLCPGCGRRVGRLHLPGRGPVVQEFKCRRCHNLTYESAQLSRSSVRGTWLALASEWGCSYAEARDLFRVHMGAHVRRARPLYFGPRELVADRHVD